MENGRDCRYISITFHPRLLYGYQGSRIASRYTDPLMENAALPAVCFDLSQEWHGEAVGFWRILYALTACAMIPMNGHPDGPVPFLEAFIPSLPP